MTSASVHYLFAMVRPRRSQRKQTRSARSNHLACYVYCSHRRLDHYFCFGHVARCRSSRSFCIYENRKRNGSSNIGSIKPGMRMRIFSFEPKISVQWFSAFIGGHTQAAQQSKTHIRPIAASRPGYREHGRQGKAPVLSQQATLTET